MVISRREFLRQSLAVTAALAGFGFLPALAATGTLCPRRRLGKAGDSVSVLGLGGYHLGTLPKKTVHDLIFLSLDLGINFIDTADCYSGGDSEEKIGGAIRGRRDAFFLMTKIHPRDRKGAMAQLERGLHRLGTDHLDLIQFHDVRGDAEVKEIFSEDGAWQAVSEAGKKGMVRRIGITGHYDASVLRGALEYHSLLDTIQIPVNAADAQDENGFIRSVLPRARKHDLGVIAMKTMVKGKLVSRGVLTAEECLRFALHQDVSLAVSGMDREDYIRENLKTASRASRESEQWIKSVLKKADSSASLEHYKK